jgi:hypothetical protein
VTTIEWGEGLVLAMAASTVQGRGQRGSGCGDRGADPQDEEVLALSNDRGRPSRRAPRRWSHLVLLENEAYIEEHGSTRASVLSHLDPDPPVRMRRLPERLRQRGWSTLCPADTDPSTGALLSENRRLGRWISS